MHSPEITVIVPVYNAERWLPRCIDSILAQTFTDFELLLIDDGSTDGSGAVCDGYAARDPRIRVFHKPNGGVSSARNEGIDNSDGKWILFVDADDWIDEKMFETLNANFKGSDIIFFSMTEHFNDGTRVSYMAKSTYSSDKSETEKNILYLKNNLAHYPFFGFTWSKIIKKEIISNNKIRFIENFALYEDELFTDACCWNAERIRLLSDRLYNYSRGNAGLTNATHKIEDLLILVENLIESASKYITPSLSDYECRRALQFLRETFNKDRNCDYFIQEINLLHRLMSLNANLEQGHRLRILEKFSPRVAKILNKLYNAFANKCY